eukprot:CAMPEP_0119123010 /NCGR_PEP_ID=MMETSP1310-20130426/3082_1 /TAXON_ID=464262 /ORGANISM="Genus nov. species nov., Strain RCC2339" /LENGTH=252 /DNA_ID=CAMNT_0007112747 /DNA_START=413 /DNA_END=1171 /DNA_ORIENTATION=+
MLMLLGGCRKMKAKDSEIVMREMIRGFSSLAREAETKVTGGQTVLNDWPLVGGVAMTFAKEQEFIRPENLVAGDVLVLTKPLGTQVAVNVREWLADEPSKAKLEGLLTEAEAIEAFHKAVTSMARLNRTAARLMQKHGAHGATDITGFGYLGHARNMAKHQPRKDVNICLHTIPVIRHMVRVSEMYPFFKLLQGFSAETSGGLLVALPSEEAARAFVSDIEEKDKAPAWIVGRVEKGNGDAHISPDARIVEV